MNTQLDFQPCPLIDGVISVSELVRKDFASTKVEQQLAHLAQQARAAIPADLPQDEQLSALLTLFFQQWHFSGISGVYQLSDAIWLDKVLESRCGLPISLGIIFLDLAQRLAIPLHPVLFPTQLILRVDYLDEDMWLINPLNGETLDQRTLSFWIKGHLGKEYLISREDLEFAETTQVIQKMLETLKLALVDEKKMELALHASEVLLQMNPNDPYEIRDRGLIYAQLDCHHIALSDLAYFIEQCPEDPVVEMIKTQMHAIEQKHITLH